MSVNKLLTICDNISHTIRKECKWTVHFMSVVFYTELFSKYAIEQ